MRPKDLKFTVDQLRKDNLTNAMQATALDILMIIVLVFSNRFFTGTLQMAVDLAAVLVATGYMLFMAIDNYLRSRTVRRYEAELHASADRQ